MPIFDRRAVMGGIQAHGDRAVHCERVSARHFRYGTAVVPVVPRSAGPSRRPGFISTLTTDVWIKARAPARGRWSIRRLARASRRIPRRAAGEAPASSVATRANRSTARAAAKAFRGINGQLPAGATRPRAPSIYSTVPWRPHCCAVPPVTHGDRRMRGRNHCRLLQRRAMEQPRRLPPNLGQAGLKKGKPMT